MKTKPSKTTVKAAGAPEPSIPQLLLTHSLTEVEKAALLNDYQPFFYQMGSRPVYFTAYACAKLKENTEQRLHLVRNRIYIEEKSAKVPRHLREVFEDPCQVLSLPTYARVQLLKTECHNMLRIMLLGRQYFVNRPGLGAKTIKVIEELFARHGCGELFK